VRSRSRRRTTPTTTQIALRHDLEIIDIMDDHAVLTDVVGERFAGLDRFEARRRSRRRSTSSGCSLGVDAHEHAVGHCSRCGTVVEPRLSDQWFVAVRPARRQGRAGRP
jgi:valyl-tRNA synthetase